MTTTATSLRIKGVIGDSKVEKILKVDEDYLIIDEIGYAADYLWFPDYIVVNNNDNDVNIHNVVVGLKYNNDIYAFSKNAMKELFDNRTDFFTHGLHIEADIEYMTLRAFNKEFNENIEFDIEYVFFGKKSPNTNAIRINSLSEFPVWKKIEAHLSRTMKPRELDLNELILPDAEEFI